MVVHWVDLRPGRDGRRVSMGTLFKSFFGVGYPHETRRLWSCSLVRGLLHRRHTSYVQA